MSGRKGRQVILLVSLTVSAADLDPSITRLSLAILLVCERIVPSQTHSTVRATITTFCLPCDGGPKEQRNLTSSVMF